jgi:aryl-alcohol dehydrogenase (NADP+)
MYAWQFAKAQHTADLGGWTRFVSMQNHYNLIYREEEREMLPLCQDMGVGVIPWSPLARGRLTRDWDATTARTETDEFGRSLYRDEDKAIVDKVAEVAQRRGVSRAQVALAWLMAQPAVTSPIVGVTKPQHLSDAVAAVDLELSADEVEELGAGYVPHPIAGHR